MGAAYTEFTPASAPSGPRSTQTTSLRRARADASSRTPEPVQNWTSSSARSWVRRPRTTSMVPYEAAISGHAIVPVQPHFRLQIFFTLFRGSRVRVEIRTHEARNDGGSGTLQRSIRRAQQRRQAAERRRDALRRRRLGLATAAAIGATAFALPAAANAVDYTVTTNG